MALLEAISLRKTFTGPSGPVMPLNDACLAAEPGEIVAICGPSGCGKTTLLLSLGGLLRPSGGTVSILGKDVYRISGEERSRLRAENIGFVFQQFHLLPYLTVLENVLAPSLARPGAESRAPELMDRLGLRQRAQHVPAQLSTGEKQRTALARAMLNDPRLLLADEPTSNLDAASAHTVVRCLLDDFVARGGAVVLVTHEAVAWEQAHRRFNMAAGRLTPDRGALARL